MIKTHYYRIRQSLVNQVNFDRICLSKIQMPSYKQNHRKTDTLSFNELCYKYCIPKNCKYCIYLFTSKW